MKRSFLYTGLLLFVSLCFQAQLNYPSGTMLFDGIHNFRSDSALVDLVKKNKVKTITQIITTKTYSVVYGEFTFNEKGQVIHMLTQQGRIGFTYNGDLCIRITRYKNKDTAESWENYVYDDKKRLLKTEQNYYNKGKLETYVDKETKLISEGKNTSRWQTNNYAFKDIYSITYSLDSTANGMHYYFEHEYRPEDVDEKGRKRGTKEMTRSYVKNNCRYEDIVKYKVYGRLESPEDLKTYYYQGDEKGRFLEFGEIDYEPAMDQYLSQHPEEFSYGILPPNMIKAILKGDLKTARTAKIKQVYDAKGRIIEKDHYDTHYTFKYNAQGQLVEQIRHGELNSSDELFYNDKGLVIRVLTTSQTNDGGDKTAIQEESNFTYTYY